MTSDELLTMASESSQSVDISCVAIDVRRRSMTSGFELSSSFTASAQKNRTEASKEVTRDLLQSCRELCGGELDARSEVNHSRDRITRNFPPILNKPLKTYRNESELDDNI